MLSKKLLLLFVSIFWLTVFSITACSQSQDIYNDMLESSEADKLYTSLNDEQKDLLDKLGIGSVDFETIFSASPHKIFDLLFEIFTNNYKSPLKSSIIVSIIIIAMNVSTQFIPDNDKTHAMISYFGCLCVSLSLIFPLSECITRVVSSIGLTSDFMLTLIPVLAAVLTAGGNPVSALNYNTLCFAAAQIVTQLADNFIRPIIQIILSLSVVSGINNALNFEKLIAFIKKSSVLLLSFMSSIFVTLLSLKGALAASADGVAVRGIRFLIGNTIPVVGGAVSDAYTSIIGTVSMVKNTVAVFAIVAVAVINLPVFAECICWIFMLHFLGALSEMFSLKNISSLINSVSSAVTLLAVSLLFVTVVFILSIGLVMVIKGG